MRTNEESLRQQVALGWIASLVILTTTLAAMLLNGVLSDAGLLGLHADPGYAGLNFLKYVSGIYLLMAIGAFALPGKRFIRWIFVGIAALMLLLLVLHHLSHWVFGQRSDFLSHLMDLEHHVAMGWVVYNSVRWARLKPVN